jgi:small subunit ribosomal protein S16
LVAVQAADRRAAGTWTAAKELEAEKKMNEAIAKKVADKKAAAAAAEAEAKAAEEAPAEEAPAEA